MPPFSQFKSFRHLAPIAAMLVTVLGALGCQSNTKTTIAQARSLATKPADPVKLARAKDDFYQAVGGDRSRLPESLQILNNLGGDQSSDPHVIAYLGAVKLLQAAHATFPWEKASLARQGLDLEDRAVALAPKDLEVRFLRGVTNYQLPGFVGRSQLAQDDLAFVAQVAEQQAAAGHLDKRAAAADLDYHGKALEQKYDAAGAIEAWKAAVRIDRDSPGGKDAMKHLAEHHVQERD